MSKLQKALFLSDKGYADLKKAIFACTLTNLAMLLPFCVTVMIFSEILSPFVSGGTIQWNHRNPDLYPACLFRLAARTVCIYHGSDCVPYYLAQPEPSKEIVRKTG